MSGITCCYNCTARHLNCHDSCPVYESQKIEYEKQKKFLKDNSYVIHAGDF